MKLSNYEKETVALWNELEKTASIYTYNATLKAQLLGLCGDYPEQVRQTGNNGYGGMTFELPKKWIKVTPPRILSPAQREVLERMNQKRWGHGDCTIADTGQCPE